MRNIHRYVLQLLKTINAFGSCKVDFVNDRLVNLPRYAVKMRKYETAACSHTLKKSRKIPYPIPRCLLLHHTPWTTRNTALRTSLYGGLL